VIDKARGLERCLATAVGVVVLAAVGCDGHSRTAGAATNHRDAESTRKFSAPLAWQRAVRVPGDASTLRLVYVTIPGRRAQRWRMIQTHAGRHVVTLLGRRLRKLEDMAAITTCVTVRSSALTDGKPVLDGAGRGQPALYRYLHSRDDRENAEEFVLSANRCPLVRQ
jgi:hypothetical protein